MICVVKAVLELTFLGKFLLVHQCCHFLTGGGIGIRFVALFQGENDSSSQLLAKVPVVSWVHRLDSYDTGAVVSIVQM